MRQVVANVVRDLVVRSLLVSAVVFAGVLRHVASQEDCDFANIRASDSPSCSLWVFDKNFKIEKLSEEGE